MTLYYLDIETTGFDKNKDKIVTIQFQKVNEYGFPIGELLILKEWESSEKDIVTQFYKILDLNNGWNFIPILTNHIFDLNFIFAKFNKYNLKYPPLEDYLFSKPLIDLKSTLIIINHMQFKGWGLDKMTNKKMDGRNVPIWYQNKEYDKIINYIEDETKSFLEFFQKCTNYMPKIQTI